jgi:hypothetical protein
MNRKRTLSIGSNNDQSDDEYELDLTPPDVEPSTVVMKKKTPPVARKTKFFNRLETLAFCTHEAAKVYFKENRLKYKLAFLFRKFLN